MDIVIAGGGVAGLEALLALRALLGDRANLTLLAPEPDFVYKPLAVAQPFALGAAHRVPLARIAADAGAELVLEGLTAVDDGAGRVRLANGATRGYDALLVATGARPVEAVEGAITWWPGGDADTYGGLLRDLEEGYAKRVAIVVPPGPVWPLPAYELALMTAGEVRGMGQHDVEITLVTPEGTPLALFGEAAGRAVREELDRAGVRLELGAVARRAGDELVLAPSGRRLAVQRVYSVPGLAGPAVAGLPADELGFLLAGDDGLVAGCRRTWAAGDGVRSPLKFGGIATHQARRAAAAIARGAGVAAEDEGEPVVEGRLLVGDRTRRLRGRGDGGAAPLWWPAGKIAGRHLPRWLAEHGVVPAAAAEPPEAGVPVRRTLSAMRGVESQYVYDLARPLRGDDPQLASLGHRMRTAR